MQNAKIKINATRPNDITTKIIDRFNYDKIINETYYIRRMSPKFMIRLDILLKDQLFKNMPVTQATQLIQSVPFFKLTKTHVRIQYPNPDRVLIIAGIKKDKIKEWLEIFHRDRNEKNQFIRNINLGSWHILEFSSAEGAAAAQRFLRSQKTDIDFHESERRLSKDKKQQEASSYKYPSRRVRIILLCEDFFKVLYDIINENMKQKFNQTFESKNGSQGFKDYIYIPIYNGEKFDEKQEQFDDAVSSQFLSQTSSAYDHSVRMKEIDVQTSNQGTQIQIIGTQLQTQEKPSRQQIEQTSADQPRKKSSQKSIKEVKETHESNSIEKQLNEKIVHKIGVFDHEIHKNRTNSLCYPSSAEPFGKSRQHPTRTNKKKQKKNEKLEQFPSLNSGRQNKKNGENKKQNKQEPEKYTRIQFLEVKKRLNAFKRQHEGLSQPDIPKAIRRQSQSVMFKHKFLDEIIKKANKEKIDRDD